MYYFNFSQVNPGADRENTTVMAAVPASGRKLPPMIVFQGQFVQTTWRPNIARDPEPYPWLYANPSEWMTSDTFFKWFKEWEKVSRSYKGDALEPRLLVYDSHLSHVWYGTLEFARIQKVTILKLPPHTTDLLQPLDVSVFKALKDYWGDILFRRLRLTRSRLAKEEFSSHLCHPDVWGKALSEENIKSGFRRTGVFPVDLDQYPQHRLNVNLKVRYDKWVEEGRPEITAEEIDEMTRLDRELPDEAEPVEEDDATLATPIASPASINGQKGKIISFFVPDESPAEMQRVPSALSSTPKQSFKETMQKQIDMLQTPKSSKPQEKRRKVNPLGNVVTSDEHFEVALTEAKRKENEKKEKKDRKEKRKQKENKKTKEVKENKWDERGEHEEQLSNEEYESDDEDIYKDERPYREEKRLFPPKNCYDAYDYLFNVWKELNPPVSETNYRKSSRRYLLRQRKASFLYWQNKTKVSARRKWSCKRVYD